ncbi:ankyrin repeat protein, partial [Teladorsagia circumcincta]
LYARGKHCPALNNDFAVDSAVSHPTKTSFSSERLQEVSVRDPEDRVALHYAAETMDLEMFQRILERDLTLLDCNLEAMHSLKQAGGNLEAVDRDRLGVLHCAASHGYHETIDFFMEAAPHTPVDQRDRAGHSALFYAVTYGHYEAAKHLLDHGASPNHQDNRLRTPSHCAAAKGQMRMLKLLKQYNASFEIQNYRGDLPVHEAVQSRSKDVVEWLLALQPSSINAASHEGRTCLHLAAAQGNLEMVVLLCTKGCFVDPLMLYKVVVDYLSKKHEAKAAAEIPEEEREKSKTTFEERLVQAKLSRGRNLHDDADENDDMMKKFKGKRRRSMEDAESHREVKSTGVNTTSVSFKIKNRQVPLKIYKILSEYLNTFKIRRASSADLTKAFPKSTSTTDLTEGDDLQDDERIENFIREELQKIVAAKQKVRSSFIMYTNKFQFPNLTLH